MGELSLDHAIPKKPTPEGCVGLIIQRDVAVSRVFVLALYWGIAFILKNCRL